MEKLKGIHTQLSKNFLKVYYRLSQRRTTLIKFNVDILKLPHNGVRFYMCGEYGEDFSRPHYHALLFNCFFPDRKKHSTGDSGSVIYTSEALTSSGLLVSLV